MAPMKRPAVTETDDTLSVAALAHRWHMKRREVRRLLGAGRLPFIQLRGRIRVPRTAVLRHEQGNFDW